MRNNSRSGGIIKFLVAGVFVLIVLAGVGIFLLYHNKDEIIRRSTEKVLTYVLDVDTTVGSAKLKIAEGAIEFQDIEIDSPEGFEADYAMKFGQVHVDADLASFRSDEPHIQLIRLAEADIKLEIKNNTTNLKQLIENAKRLAPAESTNTESETVEEAQKVYVIDLVELEQNQVGVVIPFMKGYSGNISLPNLKITDLGKKNAAEALEEIIRQVLSSILKANDGVIPQDILGGITGVMGNIREGFEGSLDNVRENVRQSGQTLQNEAEKLGGSVRNLLGGNKEEKQE